MANTRHTQQDDHVCTVTEMHARALAQFEGRRYCSIEEAARYLDIGYSTMRELLYEQKIRSQYAGRRRKVLVASLLEFADQLPVDPPASTS